MRESQAKGKEWFSLACPVPGSSSLLPLSPLLSSLGPSWSSGYRLHPPELWIHCLWNPVPPEPPERARLCHVPDVPAQAQPPLGLLQLRKESRESGDETQSHSQQTSQFILEFQPPSCQAGRKPTLSHLGLPTQYQGQHMSRGRGELSQNPSTATQVAGHHWAPTPHAMWALWSHPLLPRPNL